MSEIQGNNLVTDTNGQIDIKGNTPIKQNLNVSGFETFQSKVASKSLCKRAASVVGDITKGFFKKFFGAKFEEGAVPKEDISSKQDDVSKGNNVSKGVTMKKALKGIAGTFLALPFLIGMGSLYIANMVRFAVKNEEDIYVYELNKLFQSNNINDRKRAISYLNEMISGHKESPAEYNAAVRSLNENVEFFQNCLENLHILLLKNKNN